MASSQSKVLILPSPITVLRPSRILGLRPVTTATRNMASVVLLTPGLVPNPSLHRSVALLRYSPTDSPGFLFRPVMHAAEFWAGQRPLRASHHTVASSQINNCICVENRLYIGLLFIQENSKETSGLAI